MRWILIGLAFEIVGVLLLVWGQLQGGMAQLDDWGTGEQSQAFDLRLRKFWWWKRWPLSLGRRFGSRRHLRRETLTDSFPFIIWGFVCLMLGFILQGIGTISAHR
jgi:hypothetical protein